MEKPKAVRRKESERAKQGASSRNAGRRTTARGLSICVGKSAKEIGLKMALLIACGQADAEFASNHGGELAVGELRDDAALVGTAGLVSVGVFTARF